MNCCFRKISLLFMFSLATASSWAQEKFFTDAPESSIGAVAKKRQIVPAKYRTLQLNQVRIAEFLDAVPLEKNMLRHNTGPIIDIPMPDGGSARFHIWESSVMSPALAAKYPSIKTFTGQGIDDPTASIKVDITPAGFHAMIVSSGNGAVFIDPYARDNSKNYISYYKKNFKKNGVFRELPPLKNLSTAGRGLGIDEVQAGTCVGSQLRTYRLALAATAEYTTAQGGTVEAALASQVTTMNRVNGVYERELAIRMVLVANNDLLIYTNASTDPYSNNNGSSMLAENQNNITSIIGNANYDIGHVFSTGGGGVAMLNSVCSTGEKAKGVTGSASPVGDPFDIDYVAHEMGHQFGANHTFNSDEGFCNGNGESFTNAEPGSGSTIMAYAGICDADDLQLNSDAQFHAISFSEIINFMINGAGGNCAVLSNTNNAPPVVNAGADYTIPKSTPFTLTGSATDADGDVLSFSWEQVNVGGPFGTYNNPAGDAPLFRSFVPQATPVRYFPRLSDVINNITTKGELLPAYGRTLNFRLTARDNRAGGGGVCNDDNVITVSNVAGPFRVTYPNVGGITWLVNDFATITWNPAGTAIAPISCTNVKIELSTDGGLTYPVTLLANTANDGIEEIVVPNNITTAARIRIVSVGNIFYDISNTNFTIQAPAVTQFVFSNPLPVNICGTTSGTATLNTSGLNGFSGPIGLSASGVPSGTTVSFGAGTISTGSGTSVTLNNANTLSTGTYNITVSGVSGAITTTRIIAFVVNGIPPAPATLTNPANNATGVVLSPAFNWSAVTGAASYTLQIATSNTFSTILHTIPNITSLPVVPPLPLSENTVYYWRVTSTNTCGTGAPSVTGTFKTGITVCNAVVSTDIPKSITELVPSTVTSTITIPPAAGITISDLNITGLKGTHSFVSDLTITLTSPGGTTVVLLDEICNDEADFDINLDDESLMTTIPCPPTGGKTVKPENPLSAFDGENSAGIWTLTVTDDYDADGGSLAGWGLAFNCSFGGGAASPWTQLCPPAAGTTLASDVSGSTYQWQVNNGSGFVNISNNATYNGVNTPTLQIINAPSSWTGYQYRCVADGINSSVFTLGFTSYWTGNVSNAWENAGNWSCNTLPDAYTDVIINTGTVVVNSAAICRSIRANAGASVTVNAGFKIAITH